MWLFLLVGSEMFRIRRDFPDILLSLLVWRIDSETCETKCQHPPWCTVTGTPSKDPGLSSLSPMIISPQHPWAIAHTSNLCKTKDSKQAVGFCYNGIWPVPNNKMFCENCFLSSSSFIRFNTWLVLFVLGGIIYLGRTRFLCRMWLEDDLINGNSRWLQLLMQT